MCTVGQRINSKKTLDCIQAIPPRLQKSQFPGTAPNQILPLQMQEQTDTQVAAYFYSENTEYVIPEAFY